MADLPLPLAALVAGLLSFLSPCVLPLVPGYVSFISGTSAGEPTARRTVMLNSTAFILGFSLVFVVLGAVATSLGQLAHSYYPILTRAAGVVIIVFGLHLTGVLPIKMLYADKRLHQVKGSRTAVGAFVIGFAFAFGWTPCIGPVLAGILAIAAGEATVLRGVLLLAVYSAGLAIPFLLTSLMLNRFLRFYARFRHHLHAVEVTSGVLLIVIGSAILTRHFTLIAGYLSFLNRFSL